MRYTAQQYAKTLHDLAKETATHKRRELIRSFLGVIAKNGSLNALPEIMREFEMIADKEAKMHHLVVRAQERLSAEAVARKLPFKAEVLSLKDVRLKGGVIFEVDDLRVDNSIAMRLARARKAFTK